MSFIPRVFLAFALALASAPWAARAAANAQPLTPLNESVAGNESQDFAVRFLDAQGRPSVGESVRFANDACGLFPNGQTQMNVTTDANGIASVRFTAFPQGITCWLTANAGVQVQFFVITYVAAFATPSTAIPASRVPGEPFTILASALYGTFKLYNADISARIVPGTSSATISPASANTGQGGIAQFTVTPDARGGDYQVELQFRDNVQRFSVKALANPWQDMWWAGPQENGWGMSVVQHDDVLFSVIYAYDPGGKPTWYVMPGGAWNAAHTVYSGALYVPHGTPFTAYDASRLVAGDPVGQATVDFTDPADVALSYAIGGVQGRKSMSRQPFGPVDPSGGIVVGDMWWGGPQQNGWGVAVLQQYRSLFVVWFTYDAGGAPTWLVVPSGFWSDAQTWEGRVYRTTGSPWLGRPYDKSLFTNTDAGLVRLHFSGDTGTLDYTIDGRSGSIPLSRQPF
ncbi:MAG TPA: Ig-like domain-containing protein [Usitatibacter sp.]|nr:Ig-like domain-containing protein [Usitatibacter sp.]